MHRYYIDGTHILVEVNPEAKVDFINKDGKVSINILAIVDLHGRFTYVGAGKAGACHDMAVLQDCQANQRFPHPPPGLCLLVKLLMHQLCTQFVATFVLVLRLKLFNYYRTVLPGGLGIHGPARIHDSFPGY